MSLLYDDEFYAWANEQASLLRSGKRAIADAYKRARPSTATETELKAEAFPTACPWSFDQIADADFWPEKN